MANLGLGTGIGRSAPIGTTSPYPLQEYSIRCDGFNDNIVVDDDSVLKPSIIAVSFWANPDAVAAVQGFVCKDRAGVNDGDWAIRTESGGRVEIYTQSGAAQKTILSDSPLVIGTWYHIVYTYDGAMKMYIDNVLQADTDSHDADTTANTNEIQIGSHNDGSFFDGFIDEVAIFNKALSALEIENIYNGGIPTDLAGHTNLVGYWTFNDGSTANDTSGNDNHGAITGALHNASVPA